jgi:drug/metabolite transporter (DMT)-like permease
MWPSGCTAGDLRPQTHDGAWCEIPLVNPFTTKESGAYLQLHGCVLLWGFTAILGRLITLPADALVVWRMTLVTLMLALIPSTWAGLHKMSIRMAWVYAGIGCVVATHWLAFYGSIKLANASVAVACLGLGSIFAAVIEPIVFGRPHERSELLSGMLVVPGVSLIVGGVPIEMHLGIVAGIIAAFLSAVFAILNKRYASSDNAFAVTGVEMAAGAVMLAVPTAFWGMPIPDSRDAALLLILAAACTLLPFVLWLRSLRYVSAFRTQLLLNLEPIYAILLAAVFFQEYSELTSRFYLGAIMVVCTVLLQPWLRRWTRRKIKPSQLAAQPQGQ